MRGFFGAVPIKEGLIRARQFPALLLIVFSGAGCLSGKSTILTPLGIVEMEPEKLPAETTKLALARTVVILDLFDTEPIAAEFDSLIEATVREAGFTIVPREEMDNILDGAIEKVNGKYDAITGKPDSATQAAVRRVTFEALRSQFDTEAVLFPTIEKVSIEFTKGTVKWLGASECIPMRWYMPGCGPYKGVTEASALFVTIMDTDGEVVFRNGGGIQLLRKLGTSLSEGWNSGLGGGTRGTVVPRDKLFIDKQLNIDAVKIALYPLCRHEATAEAICSIP